MRDSGSAVIATALTVLDEVALRVPMETGKVGPAVVGEGVDVHRRAARFLELPVEGVGEAFRARTGSDRGHAAAQVARLADAERIAPEHHQVIADDQIRHGLDACRLRLHGEGVGDVHLARGKRRRKFRARQADDLERESMGLGDGLRHLDLEAAQHPVLLKAKGWPVSAMPTVNVSSLCRASFRST